MSKRSRVIPALRPRLLLLGALCASLLISSPAAATPPEAPARFLVIVLDAVPFETILALTHPTNGETPLLAGLRGPVPLISTFPSSTSVALTAILGGFGLEAPPGYEAKFFDHEAGKIRGGGLVSYSKIRFDWHNFFDWQLHGFFSKSRAYGWPRRWGQKEVDKGLAAFEATNRETFFIYVNSTDALGHTKGPEELRGTLVHLDVRLREIRERSPVPIHVVLLSDHGQDGGFVLPNIRSRVSTAIKEAGWRVSAKLVKPEDVVLTPFGLVSSFEVYTHPDIRSDVAETVASQPGVDLCAYPDDGGWVIVNAEGRALARQRSDEWRGEANSTEWSYRVETADPLRYANTLARLRIETGATQWFRQAAWFEQTWNEEYPDALHRIAGGFEGVLNPASILCSVESGHLFGSKSAYIGARYSVGRVKWTHGALNRDATQGFLMTDFPGWEPPPAVSFDHALDFLVEHLEKTCEDQRLGCADTRP